ncbi:hypothetical protein GUITHDRAFT_149702 [Guillardia theta CCMP2712]|uniref:Uncharacterized protein n=1 Tax=Guillardia theta (strain CCMP2712) TaxID=905079 RepID=L1K3F0_GUITC|nr:hypothetical protein GUITHDRAFT_149702 [Guillardia theta CCMP2712]EKX55117.1 hypothetical protein GUITHDRAFT_149702 [Guillardia theta CCMP2712]|eukprot:XP_005842097.1 hypothetical protein GUITHDRAFT_149702 [Guillardia theta CCMP2712]
MYLDFLYLGAAGAHIKIDPTFKNLVERVKVSRKSLFKMPSKNLKKKQVPFIAKTLVAEFRCGDSGPEEWRTIVSMQT